MSFIYSIVSVIDAEYHPEPVEKVLTKGVALGCKYYREISDLDINPNNTISTKEAVRILFEKEPRFDGEPFPAILTYSNGAFFHFFFGKSDCGNLRINLTICGYPLEREFDGYHEKDFARYARFLLDVTNDFPLLDIHMEKL